MDATQNGGFDFLGYHFERGMKWPRQKSLKKLKDTIRAKTKRTNGHSLQTIIADVNRTLTGWFEYFKHSHRTTFPTLDSWIRMRLRSILRKRHGPAGPGTWARPSTLAQRLLCEHGLFSLVAAHALARQSCYEVNHQLESRMREIRLSGSEGGGAEFNRPSLPLSKALAFARTSVSQLRFCCQRE